MKANRLADKWRGNTEVATRVPIIMGLCFAVVGIVGNMVGDLYLGGIGLGGILALAFLGLWGIKTK